MLRPENDFSIQDSQRGSTLRKLVSINRCPVPTQTPRIGYLLKSRLLSVLSDRARGESCISTSGLNSEDNAGQENAGRSGERLDDRFGDCVDPLRVQRNAGGDFVRSRFCRVSIDQMRHSRFSGKIAVYSPFPPSKLNRVSYLIEIGQYTEIALDWFTNRS
jgi:hypothetical protein